MCVCVLIFFFFLNTGHGYLPDCPIPVLCALSIISKGTMDTRFPPTGKCLHFLSLPGNLGFPFFPVLSHSLWARDAYFQFRACSPVVSLKMIDRFSPLRFPTR